MKSAYQVEFELLMRKQAIEAARPAFAALAEFHRNMTNAMVGVGKALTKALMPTVRALEKMGEELANNEREVDGLGH